VKNNSSNDKVTNRPKKESLWDKTIEPVAINIKLRPSKAYAVTHYVSEGTLPITEIDKIIAAAKVLNNAVVVVTC
jgi:hypothetical protein